MNNQEECDCGKCQLTRLMVEVMQKRDVDFAVAQHHKIGAVVKEHFPNLDDTEVMALCAKAGMDAAYIVAGDDKALLKEIADFEMQFLFRVQKEVQQANATTH